jgi:tetratricopeptide (TPR) repeat protein
MTQVDLLAAAVAHHQAGRTAQAERLYRELLAADPDQPDALHRLGVLCLHAGRGDEAIDLIGRAVALRPNHAEYANHLGGAYGILGRYDEAIAALRRAVQIAPGDAGAHYNLGNALKQAGRTADAIVSFRHAVAANPAAIEAHNNLGSALRDLGRLSEAETAFRDALRVQPTYLKALVNLGCVLHRQKRLPEAMDVLRQAVARDPSHARAHMDLGTVLRDAARFTEAVESLRRAVELAPQDAQAHNNLGTALQALARFGEAQACYEAALRLNPELGDAHFGLATMRLRQGDLAGGFAEYEWRWKCGGFSDRGFPQPRWQGEPLEGRTILLYGEQGLGDTLHFVRFAAHARQRGGRVIVECHPPLVHIVAGAPGVDRVIPFNSPLPSFDVHAPLMSLPGILALGEADLWQGPYLTADPARREQWRQRLAAYPGFRVGLCWQGNPNHLFDVQRSFPPASFAPLAGVPGVRMISLQKDADRAQLAAAPFELVDLRPEFDDEPGAFANAAAVIENLDLVITCDTAIAHLAGALGAPVWLALSAHADWRWMLKREDSPWYPSMRIFRQHKLDAWDDVFRRMADALGEMAPRHQSPV